MCGTQICTQCSVPISSTQSICQACVNKLHSGSTKNHGIEPIEFEHHPLEHILHTPFTLLFCLALTGLYLISAAPHWVKANFTALAITNLDIGAVTQQQQLWRLLTANLFHVNLAHLGSNVFSILIFGHLLEAQVGWRVVLLWSLLSMLACDVASIMFDVNHSVGASGIAYGLQTAFLVLAGKALIVNKVQSPVKTLQSLVGYLILIVAINLMSPAYLNIYGHFGGALAGLLGALMYPVSRPFSRRDCIAPGALLVAEIMLLAWLVYPLS